MTTSGRRTSAGIEFGDGVGRNESVWCPAFRLSGWEQRSGVHTNRATARISASSAPPSWQSSAGVLFLCFFPARRADCDIFRRSWCADRYLVGFARAPVVPLTVGGQGHFVSTKCRTRTVFRSATDRAGCSLIKIHHCFYGPFRIRRLRALHRAPENAVKDVFRTTVRFVELEAS